MIALNTRPAGISGLAGTEVEAGIHARPVWDARSRRVAVLMLGVIVLSLADLFITLAYLRAQWMMEANPIAVFVIKSTQSPWSIAAFKGLTVLVCVSLLMKARKHLAAEVAAWCAVAILAVLSVMWHNYANHVEDNAALILAQTGSTDDVLLGLP
jgi:hypothetical protein